MKWVVADADDGELCRGTSGSDDHGIAQGQIKASTTWASMTISSALEATRPSVCPSGIQTLVGVGIIGNAVPKGIDDVCSRVVGVEHGALNDASPFTGIKGCDG